MQAHRQVGGQACTHAHTHARPDQPPIPMTAYLARPRGAHVAPQEAPDRKMTGGIHARQVRSHPVV
eukprot:10543230-Alexandrium_andersonii.AAC.1